MLVTGAALPDRLHTLSAVTMTAYAGATWDWLQIHIDRQAAREAGFSDAIVDGQLLGALLAAHAQDGVGPGSRVRELAFRHTAPVYRNETVRITGTCVAVQPQGSVTVRQDVEVVDPTTHLIHRVAVRSASTTVQAPPAPASGQPVPGENHPGRTS